MKALSFSLAILLMGFAGLAQAQEKKVLTFSSLEVSSPEIAQTKAQAWLKEIGKTDAASQAKFDAIWKLDASILERVTQTLILGDAQAAKLLEASRDVNIPAPTEIPAVFKDAKASTFLKANLSVAYARALAQRKIYEEGLESLKLVKAEQVVDPATYLFYRALCEHSLLQKAEASKTIFRLIEDVNGSPDRYRTVAALMLLDMQTWKDKDLGSIGRKMNVIKDRLEIARGGPKTQQLQKEVVMRLDEIIKELENKNKNQQQGQGDPNGGSCPSGGQQPGQPGSPGGLNPPSAPAADAGIAGGQSTGKVDAAKMKTLLEKWGSLPPKEREQALQKLTENLSPRHREAIDNYFRNLANATIRK